MPAKKELSKIQRLAEKETDDAEWSRRQDDVWTKLSALEHLSGLLARTDGTYGTFRDAYLRTLTEMRAQLAGRSESPARAASRRGRAARS
jgi:hypothetical protein